MSDVVIRAEGLGKKYLIGHQSNERYTALRDVLARSVGGIARSASALLKGQPIIAGDEIEEFWALKDVSFEIKRGDVVGVIGRNGAGKSTLLKVLSRITEPSEGRVEIKGRVASLLEVGTGFHPELTGRENIFLNGAILGMTGAEIRKKFDEIVAFAEVEKFLDTPVKRYSSGMYVRLAFSVAAHLEPEILVVDEVLAVGDATFQKKCLGKMQDVAGHGRTVLFVSHNMAAVRSLCRSAILLSAGSLVATGSIEHVISQYTEQQEPTPSFSRSPNPNSVISITSVEACYEESGSSNRFKIDLGVHATQVLTASIDIRLKDRFGAPIALASIGGLSDENVIRFTEGDNRFEIALEVGNLAAGTYVLSIDLAIPQSGYLDRAEDCLTLSIEPSPPRGASRVIQQAWGYGSIYLGAQLASPSRH